MNLGFRAWEALQEQGELFPETDVQIELEMDKYGPVGFKTSFFWECEY